MLTRGIYYITLTSGVKSPVTLGSWRPFQFDTLSVQSVLPRPPPFSEREKQLIDEITKLQTKGLLGKFLSVLMNLFQIFFWYLKKTGDLCPVINLKPLNQFVQRIHFKMENIQMAMNFVSLGNYMVSIDP